MIARAVARPRVSAFSMFPFSFVTSSIFKVGGKRPPWYACTISRIVGFALATFLWIPVS